MIIYINVNRCLKLGVKGRAVWMMVCPDIIVRLFYDRTELFLQKPELYTMQPTKAANKTDHFAMDHEYPEFA